MSDLTNQIIQMGEYWQDKGAKVSCTALSKDDLCDAIIMGIYTLHKKYHTYPDSALNEYMDKLHVTLKEDYKRLHETSEE